MNFVDYKWLNQEEINKAFPHTFPNQKQINALIPFMKVKKTWNPLDLAIQEVKEKFSFSKIWNTSDWEHPPFWY